MSIPQFAAMQQPSKPSTFTGSVVASALPKILAFSQVAEGNICLYEVTKLVILLSVPNGVELKIEGVNKGNQSYQTPHGDKTGYVFYKNNKNHMDKLNELFNGSEWRSNLSEPLPEPAAAKDPSLLCKRIINWKGRQFEIVLYEYSDKSLALFTPIDVSEGNDKLLKPWRGLTCPDAPGGKANGYLCYKNNTGMINFMKSLIPDVPFESMYKKSQPINSSVIKQQKDPQLLETKQFMHGDQVFILEIYEYSEAAIALFPTPLINLNGFTLSDCLKHPTQGTRQGYSIAKANEQQIESIEKYFGFNNLKNKYTMMEEVARGVAIIPPNGIMPPGPGMGGLAASLSDMSVKSLDEIPLETLVRLIQNKLKTSAEITNKELLGDKIMSYGNLDKVLEQNESNDDLKLVLSITAEDKALSLFERA